MTRPHRRSPLAMRRSTVALSVIAAGLLFLAATLVVSAVNGGAGDRIHRVAALAGRLYLTDLALFTEARYTRHPSQADLFSAFQDHPMALEHFPSGTLVPPPAFGGFVLLTADPPADMVRAGEREQRP